ncbi:MAG: hypothetical protein ACRDGL_02400 [Candidatus Limnocylindrales bacterium]
MIEYLPGLGPTAQRRRPSVTYVGGPRAGVAERRAAAPATIALPGGRYERSVACADDGALRYVWVTRPPPNPAPTAAP